MGEVVDINSKKVLIEDDWQLHCNECGCDKLYVAYDGVSCSKCDTYLTGYAVVESENPDDDEEEFEEL